MIGRFLGIALATVLLSVLSSGNTFASSIYDGHYRHTNTAEIKGTTCTSVNIASSWSQYILDEAKWGSGNMIQRNAAKNSLAQALTNGGRWAVSEVEYSTGEKYVKVYWTTDDALSLQWDPTDILTTAPAYEGNYVYIMPSNPSAAGVCVPDVASIGIGGYPAGGYGAYMSNVDDPYTDIRNLFIMTDYPNYPANYEGAAIVTGYADTDEDGLSAAKEAAQGTFDTNKDSDEDGLNDFIESQWNPSRDDVFCGTVCAYPNPVERDIYLEIDWMKNGTEEYKPSSTQINLVKDAFNDKNINLYVDMGLYGGGNELPVYISELKFVPTTNETDFFNLKNGDENYSANFSEDRRGIWHYLATGYKQNINGSNTSTGVAYPGDDDAFVSIGRVEELAPLGGEDVAIAGTIIHELGHNLCLSDSAYTGQDSACLFSDIDTYAGNDYPSAMNYDKQLTLIDYSEGLNPSGDHNDWSAILIGMDDFVTLGEDPTEDLQRGKPIFDKPLLY